MSRSSALAPLLLLAYGLAFAASALGRGLLVFDDHPGQLYRLRHAVELGLPPWRWNPGWWAGYAELQFYPPGFSYAGALLHGAALGALAPETTYRLLLWATYLLPGLAVWALLARVLRDPWLALPGAFLALALSAESRSGVEEGLRWGLVAARLGWGLLPLLALALLRWVEGGARIPVRAVALLAAVILVHPAHAGAALSMVVLGAAIGPASRSDRARRAALAVGLSVGLSAFWLLPLVVRLSLALPLAWGDASLLGLARRLVDYPLLAVLALANVAAWTARGRLASPPAATWLLALAPATLALVCLDALVAAPLGLAWLPADRLADGLLLALVLGSAVALAGLRPLLPRAPTWALALGALLLAVLLAGGRSEPTLSLWPRAREWPTYDEVLRGTRLDELWQAIRRAPPGRILFVRSSVPLEYRPEWWRAHSHITALTPLATGRAIVNGTFTHPSPVAGFVYTGSAAPAPLTLLVEQRDGVTLFGRPVETIAPRDFDRIASALGISAVVALDEDAPRLRFLAGPEGFAERARVGPFVLFVSRVPRTLAEPLAPGPPSRVVASPPPGGAAASPSGTAWWSTGIAYSPLWSARSASGPLPTRRGEIGLLEVATPAGAASPVELSYAPGTPEWLGIALSAGAAIALATGAARRRWFVRPEAAPETGH